MIQASAVGKLRRVTYTTASQGLWRSMLDVFAPGRPYHPATDLSFDERFGTDTAGSIEPAQLGIDDVERRKQAILYLPSPAKVTNWMLDNVGIDPRTFTFVDIGCGKGRVLLIASERPFQRLLGVEISAELCAIARRNVELYQPASRAKREIAIEVRLDMNQDWQQLL